MNHILKLLKDIDLHNMHVDDPHDMSDELRDRLQDAIENIEKVTEHVHGDINSSTQVIIVGGGMRKDLASRIIEAQNVLNETGAAVIPELPEEIVFPIKAFELHDDLDRIIVRDQDKNEKFKKDQDKLRRNHHNKKK